MRAKARRATLVVGALLLLAGSGLLVLSVAGLVTSPERPDAPARQSQGDERGAATGALTRRAGESGADYAERLTRSVHLRMRHYWDDDNGVGLAENWALWAAQRVAPATRRLTAADFENWEYVGHERALDRGYGLCSQHALAVADVLRDQDIGHAILLLDGHVVVEAPLGPRGEPMILDADYGVTIAGGVRAAEREPSTVRRAYAPVVQGAAAPYGTEPVAGGELLRTLETIYRPPNGRATIAEVAPVAGRIETAAYMLKWLLPALAMLLGGLLVARHRARPAGG